MGLSLEKYMAGRSPAKMPVHIPKTKKTKRVNGVISRSNNFELFTTMLRNPARTAMKINTAPDREMIERMMVPSPSEK